MSAAVTENAPKASKWPLVRLSLYLLLLATCSFIFLKASVHCEVLFELVRNGEIPSVASLSLDSDYTDSPVFLPIRSIAFLICQQDQTTASIWIVGLNLFAFSFVVMVEYVLKRLGKPLFDPDNFYFLGFLLTLLSLIIAFLFFESYETPEQRIVALINAAGIALATTVMGLIARQIFVGVALEPPPDPPVVIQDIAVPPTVSLDLGGDKTANDIGPSSVSVSVTNVVAPPEPPPDEKQQKTQAPDSPDAPQSASPKPRQFSPVPNRKIRQPKETIKRAMPRANS